MGGVSCSICYSRSKDKNWNKSKCPRCQGTGEECAACGHSYDKEGCSNPECSSFRENKVVV